MDKVAARTRGRVPLPSALQPVYGAIEGAFRNPQAALLAWYRLATDGAYRDEDGQAVYPNRARASWYLRPQPLAFVEPTPDPDRLATATNPPPQPRDRPAERSGQRR